MSPRSEIVCQYLEGGREGAKCGAVDRLIKEVEKTDIRICLSRRYEVCCYYKRSLRRTGPAPSPPGL